MAIQVFGTKKCRDTQKALRFFKERNTSIHFIDLSEKGFSAGELKSIANTLDLETLLDPDSREYQKKNLAYLNFDPFEVILESPLVIVTPIIRNGKQVTAGYDPDSWKTWF